MSTERGKSKIDWNADMEIKLFKAMLVHKPVGPDRHFQIMYIANKLKALTGGVYIPVSEIWGHLSKLYCMEALHESEVVPFPTKEKEFGLPEEEFGELQQLEFPRVAASSCKKKTRLMAKLGDDNKSDVSSSEGLAGRGRKRARKSGGVPSSASHSRSQSPAGSVEAISSPNRRKSKRH